MRKLQQTNPMMAMMQGMMGMNPMQMAMMQQMGHMGMMPPGYWAAQQAHMMMAGDDGKASRKKRRTGAGGGKGAAAAAAGENVPEESSSSSSDSSSDSEEGGTVAASQAAMMAAMWPGAAAAAAAAAPSAARSGPPSAPLAPATAEDVDAFLAANPVDPDAADRLRALPPLLQQVVLQRGPVADTRNPSAVLITRIRDAELGRGPGSGATAAPVASTGHASQSAGADPEYSTGAFASRGSSSPKPARRSAKVSIETLIRDYRLSPGCAWMLRALPPDKQKLAARIDPAGETDPSGYVAEQLKKIV